MLRAHIWVRVVHHDAEASERIGLGAIAIDAGVTAHISMMKAIEVDAFSVDLGEPVFTIRRVADIARGIDGNRNRASFHVNVGLRKADVHACVSFHPYSEGVAHLNGVAAYDIDAIVRDQAVRISRRGVKRVSPDSIASNAPELAVGYAEIASAFFEQNSARCIVTARRIP